MSFDAMITSLRDNAGNDFDVAQLALWMARDEYPDLDVDAYLGEIKSMAHEARAFVRGSLEARVAGFRRYMFHEMGFRGNTTEYYDPRNSYLNEVLDRRTGIPISLSIVAIAIGRHAGLPLVGVGLPGHFIVRTLEKGQPGILMDPFHGGRRLELEECANLVRQVTGMEMQLEASHLAPVCNKVLLTRMLSNLKGVYLKQADFVRGARIIERLRQLHPEDAMQDRDLGMSYLHCGRPGRAISLLESFLKRAPKADENGDAAKWLRMAYKMLGQWN